MINENARSAADMSRQSQFALIALVVAGLVSALVAGAMTAWISTMKTARPLAELSRRMNALAAGELEVEIGGLERKDEIGDMARAVQVLKEHAAERVRLEASAAVSRHNSEEERERAAAERAKAAGEQAEVVRQLSVGLKALADGDLMVRLRDGFSPTYAQIRDDFNAAIGKLSAAIEVVMASAGGDAGWVAVDRFRRRRSVPPHRTTGGEPRGDRRDAESGHWHGAKVGGGRRSRARGRGRRRRGGAEERRRGAARRSRR